MRGFTRVETILNAANIGGAILAGFNGDRAAVARARALQTELRQRVGYTGGSATVLTSGAAQSKLGKNSLASFGLMLTPERGMMRADLADVRDAFAITGAVNVCPLASAGCALACLVTSGQSGMPTAQRAQAVRTAMLLAYPYETGLIIGAELRAAVRRHGRINLRLNTTSDIRWELVMPGVIDTLTDAGIHFYDYTAWHPSDRMASDNYPLTYSAKETAHTPDAYLESILASGGNVAMPFDTRKGEALPTQWHGYPVIDGDVSDERRLDPKGVVIGLRAKGHVWRRDNTSGFIRHAASA